MTKIAIQTEPTAEPVTLLELRDHLEVIDPVKNEYAEALIKVARQSLEEMTWSAFVTQTWDQWFDGFASPLKLKKPPVASITSVTYTDTAGDTQTLSTDVYELGDDNGIGIVRLKDSQVWPATQPHADVVKVRFATGVAAASVKAGIKHAIKLLAAHLFEHREPVVIGQRIAVERVPMTVRALIGPYSYREFR